MFVGTNHRKRVGIASAERIRKTGHPRNESGLFVCGYKQLNILYIFNGWRCARQRESEGVVYNRRYIFIKMLRKEKDWGDGGRNKRIGINIDWCQYRNMEDGK
jgi:hypothetical protein